MDEYFWTEDDQYLDFQYSTPADDTGYDPTDIKDPYNV